MCLVWILETRGGGAHEGQGAGGVETEGKEGEKGGKGKREGDIVSQRAKGERGRRKENESVCV